MPIITLRNESREGKPADYNYFKDVDPTFQIKAEFVLVGILGGAIVRKDQLELAGAYVPYDFVIRDGLCRINFNWYDIH